MSERILLEKKKNQIRFVLMCKDQNWRHRVYPNYSQTKFGSILVFVCFCFYLLHFIQSLCKGFLHVKCNDSAAHVEKACSNHNQEIYDKKWFSSRDKFAHSTIFPFPFVPSLFPFMANILFDFYIVLLIYQLWKICLKEKQTFNAIICACLKSSLLSSFPT